MRSLTERGASDQVLVVGRQSITFGTSVPYAAFHRTVKDGTALVSIDRSHKAALAAELKRSLLEGL